MSNEERMQAAREAILSASAALVKAAQALGDPPQRWVVTPGNPREVINGCGPCEDGECARHPHVVRYPCSATCTHDDADNPSHPERVKALSVSLRDAVAAQLPAIREAEQYEAGAEAMRAACLLAAENECWKVGVSPHQWSVIKAAIEGATP